MLKILINYDYSQYPFTTASYYEMAARRRDDLAVYRRGDVLPPDLDLVLNIEPVGEFVRIPGVPCHYYEIDNHVIIGGERWYYEQADVLWLAHWNFRKFYTDYNIKELACAADPNLHRPFFETLETYDIGFIGNDTYPERRKYLEQLEQNFKVLRTTSEPGIAYSKKLAQCKILFNCSMNDDINMRIFENVACEKLSFTNRIPELDRFLVEDEHFIGYSNWAELKEKIQYYLERGCYRRTIARQGRAHVVEHHSYDQRLNDVLATI